MNSLDEHLFLYLASFRHPALESLAEIINSPLWIILPASLALLWGLKQRHWRLLRRLLALSILLILSNLSCDLLKAATARPRPRELIPGFSPPPRARPLRSFPSAHVANTSALLILAHAFWPKIPNPLLLLIPWMVALARLYVGAHWPSDLLMGALLGALIAWSALRIRALLDKKSRGAL